MGSAVSYEDGATVSSEPHRGFERKRWRDDNRGPPTASNEVEQLCTRRVREEEASCTVVDNPAEMRVSCTLEAYRIGQGEGGDTISAYTPHCRIARINNDQRRRSSG